MKYTKEQVQELLQTDMRWLTRGIVAIYERQTYDEQRSESTKHFNKRGFRGSDAKFLTSLAKWIIAGRSLTEKQTYVARKRMDKYAGQICTCIKEKAARQAA